MFHLRSFYGSLGTSKSEIDLNTIKSPYID